MRIIISLFCLVILCSCNKTKEPEPTASIQSREQKEQLKKAVEIMNERMLSVSSTGPVTRSKPEPDAVVNASAAAGKPESHLNDWPLRLASTMLHVRRMKKGNRRIATKAILVFGLLYVLSFVWFYVFHSHAFSLVPTTELKSELIIFSTKSTSMHSALRVFYFPLVQLTKNQKHVPTKEEHIALMKLEINIDDSELLKTSYAEEQ